MGIIWEQSSLASLGREAKSNLSLIFSFFWAFIYNSSFIEHFNHICIFVICIISIV
jgi:hypothetical protein